MHLNKNKNFSLVRLESTLSMYLYCTHVQIWILTEIHLIYKQRRDAPIKKLQPKHAEHNNTTKIKRQKVVETVAEEEYFNSKNSNFLVQNSNFLTHSLRNGVKQTSNCVLILAVNINVNVQIKLNSSICKANFYIFTKLNVESHIPLTPKASIQITATVD